MKSIGNESHGDRGVLRAFHPGQDHDDPHGQEEGRIDGSYGYMIHEDVLFSPVFGYEMSIPQEVGLYRMLVYRLVQDAFDLGLAIETGGGADEFKSMRGDSPVARYGAFYVRHLPAFRKGGLEGARVVCEQCAHVLGQGVPQGG